MTRRKFVVGVVTAIIFSVIGKVVYAATRVKKNMIEKVEKTKDEWREILSPEAYRVMREEGTERPFTSPLNDEKREGDYNCAGCDLTLFTSDMKFDSGTGWPSFFTVIEDHIGTSRDFKMIYPRTEYHCAKCGGHQGHIFSDGPAPTKLRYCNNGVALKFAPKS